MQFLRRRAPYYDVMPKLGVAINYWNPSVQNLRNRRTCSAACSTTPRALLVTGQPDISLPRVRGPSPGKSISLLRIPPCSPVFELPTVLQRSATTPCCSLKMVGGSLRNPMMGGLATCCSLRTIPLGGSRHLWTAHWVLRKLASASQRGPFVVEATSPRAAHREWGEFKPHIFTQDNGRLWKWCVSQPSPKVRETYVSTPA